MSQKIKKKLNMNSFIIKYRNVLQMTREVSLQMLEEMKS